MFYLDLMKTRELVHKIFYIHVHVILPIDFPQIAIHLSGTLMNRISGVMGFCKNMFSQLTVISNTQSTVGAKYTVSLLGENLHTVIMTAPLSSTKITVLLSPKYYYQRRLCPILHCYTTV